MAKKKSHPFRKEKYIVVKPYTNQYGEKSYYFTVKFNYKVANGKVKTYTKTFNSKDYFDNREALREACNHRDIMRGQMLMNRAIDKSKLTVGDLWALFPKAYTLEYSTLELYRHLYENYIQEDFEYTPISDVMPIHIQECLNESTSRMNSKSIMRLETLWRKLYHVARKQGVMLPDVMDLVEHPRSKKDSKSTKAMEISDDDMFKMYDYLNGRGGTDKQVYENRTLASMFLVMRLTGLRPEECGALAKEDIDSGIIHVRHALKLAENDSGTKVSIIGVPKNPESVRDVPISGYCQLVLDDVMNYCKTDILFTKADGRLFKISKLSSRVTDLARRAGVKITMSTMRHQFDTDLLVEFDTDIRTVQELMGHSAKSNRAFGQTIEYARSNPEKKREAVEKIGQKVEKSRKAQQKPLI